jgi:hypothetical protein
MDGMGGMDGRVAESSKESLDEEATGADIGAPQLGHASAAPDARAVRRPQTAHAISGMGDSRHGEPKRRAPATGTLLEAASSGRGVIDRTSVIMRYLVFLGPIRL